MKSKAAIPYVHKIKKRLKEILKDPIVEAKKEYDSCLLHNNTLCFKLLHLLKPNKLLRYKSSYVKIVYRLRGRQELYPLGLNTLKDRTVQMLFKLVMEAYLEPLGDLHSFGFRPGRDCLHAVAEVANHMRYNKRYDGMIEQFCVGRFQKKNKVVVRKRSSSSFYAKQTIIEGAIRGCFNNISHS